MTQPTQIQAQLEIEGCTAELYLNDVPVMRLRPGDMKVQLLAVEQLVIPGKNRLEVLVEPGPTPNTAREASRVLEKGALGEAPRASAKLVRFTITEEPSIADPEILMEATWQWPIGPDDPVLFPQSAVAERDLGDGRGPWRWQSLPPHVLDRGLHDEVMRFLDEMEAAFLQGDLDLLWDLSRQQNEDVQRCYPGLTETFLRGDMARVVDFYRRSPDPVFPRDPARTALRLAAGGRMLHVIDRDWTPTYKLRDPDDGTAVGVPMLLGRVDGKLRIVR